MREAKGHEAPSENLAGYYSSCVYPRNFDGLYFVFLLLKRHGEKIEQFLLGLPAGDGP
ncbi:hypothetical protein D3C80_1689340 [compost metagenome]